MRYGHIFLVASAFGLVACDGDSKAKPAAHQIGDEVDFDGDGETDGVVVDDDGDGKPDGVDTDGDGKSDTALPVIQGDAGTSSRYDGDASSDGRCTPKTVHSDLEPADILVVLDRSTSMQENDDGNVDRWTPSKEAVQAVTSSLDSQIRFGLMVFPGGPKEGGGLGGGGGGGPGGGTTCEPGQLEVPIALDTAGEIEGALDGMGLLAGTPTPATLREAHEVLGSGLETPDAPPKRKFVLLVTDGAPNCTNDVVSRAPDPVAVQDSVDEIESLAADGIKTYVVGYDTQGDPDLEPALNRMAVAGGTGDSEHRPVEDRASLEKTFAEIAGGAISCSYRLESKPSDPSYVLVQVDGEQLNLNDPNGWVLSKDGQTVTVQGEPCDLLRNGGAHALTVQILCDKVVAY